MEKERGQERPKKEENLRWKANYRQETSVRGFVLSVLFTGSRLKSNRWAHSQNYFYCIFPRPIKSPNSAYLRLCVGTRDCCYLSHLIGSHESRWGWGPCGLHTAGLNAYNRSYVDYKLFLCLSNVFQFVCSLSFWWFQFVVFAWAWKALSPHATPNCENMKPLISLTTVLFNNIAEVLSIRLSLWWAF